MDKVYGEWHVIEALLSSIHFLTFMFVCSCFATAFLFPFFLLLLLNIPFY